MQNGYVLLARGVLSGAAGTGEQSAPASGATATLWSSASNVNSNWGGPRFKRLVLSVISSHDSAANGVSFEESNDSGTTWETLKQYTYATADGYTKYYVAVSAPMVRVRYTNSANTLTTWRFSLLGDVEERGNVS